MLKPKVPQQYGVWGVWGVVRHGGMTPIGAMTY